MGGYLSTSNTYTIKDYYGNDWVQASLAVTVDSAGSGSWTLTMTNDEGGGHWHYLGLYLSIAGSVIYNKYYTTNNVFPTGHNKSASGTFSTSAASFNVDLRLCTMQDGNVGNRWTDGTAARSNQTFTRTTWSDIGTGSVTITDNGNNSYTVSGTKGAAGTNNAVNGATLYWASGKNSAGNWDYSYQSFTTGSSKTVSFTPTSAASRTVAAAVVTDGVYNDTDTGWVTKGIKQYRDPGAPGKPTLDSSSYRNGRLTIKQNWKYTWTAGTDGTSSCPVLGYRIRIYKNGSLVTGFSAGSNSVLTKNSGTNEYVDRSGKTDCAIILDPVSFGFVPGDTVQIGLYAYAQNGAGTWLYNGGGSGASQVTSDTSTVQNSGVMRVRPEDSWKEGVVWVKVNNTWKEAEVVHTKVSDSWKEST